MEQYLLIVEANCKDSSKQAQMDAWYDSVHIPDILGGSPGFLSATRYVLKDPTPGRGHYLAVYEIESDDIEKTMQAHSKNLQEKYAAGHNTELLELVSRKVCKVL
jgi:hypothetical protein